MTRFLAACAMAATLVVPVNTVSAAPPVEPGGRCNGAVDAGCRTHECQPDELDCGMVPPCLVWVGGACRLG